MPSQPTSQALIDACLGALQLRRLGECQARLAELCALAEQQPALEPWCAYLRGILAFEIEHDWTQAERAFTQLLRRELEPALRGRALYALGRAYDIQGRWAAAIATFGELADAGLPIERAKAHKHIAISYRNGFAQGDFGPEALRAAVAHCRQALGTLAPIEPRTDELAWLEGSIWNTLGATYMNLAQWRTSIGCYRRDIAICRALGDTYGIAVSTLNLGEVYHRRGPAGYPKALAAYRSALRRFRAFHDQYLEADALANLALLHHDMGAPDVALDHYRQAMALLEQLRADVGDAAGRAGFFATVADTYANAALLCAELGDTAGAFAIVERARSRAFLDTLAARSAELSRRFEAPTLTLAEAQAALPAEAVLLAYFTTGLVEARPGQPERAPPQRHRFPPARTLVFVVSRAGAALFDAGVSPNDLRPSQLGGASEQHFLGEPIRRTLYHALLGPAATTLAGARRLYLAPHGPLHYVPFGALLAPDGAPLLRANGPQIVYGFSATQLLGSAAVPERAPRPALALGYNGAGPGQLRFGEDEARAVARLAGGRSLAGRGPKKARLYQLAGQYRLLHFSCHGMFDPTAPLASALRLAPGEDLTALDVIERLRLRCELVTLSACESGLSRVHRGDELLGLARAFLLAGAPALLCTLWRVDERATRLLMEYFYQAVRAGADFATALQQAQLALQHLTRSQARGQLAGLPAADAWLDHGPDDELLFAAPFFWAPFILIASGAARL